MKIKNYLAAKTEQKIKQINRRIEYFSEQYLVNRQEDDKCRTYLIIIEEKLWALEDALTFWKQKRKSVA